jgi:alpha-D-ribose 1-methylphosphonate 5-phosphate C-P lyase
VTNVAELTRLHGSPEPYAYLDEASKREVRRAILKALALPGRQIPFASREMPIARGWGSGALQVTLSVVGPDDVVKVIDQGADASLNAQAMRALIATTAECEQTTRTAEATIIQSRHRIPETPLRSNQLLVLQVPQPDPLQRLMGDAAVSAAVSAAMHAEGDHTLAWLERYEDEVRRGGSPTSAGHPVLVNDRVLMGPSPIPPHDIARLDNLPHPVLFGAGRLARVMALPPHSMVKPLSFADRPFLIPDPGVACAGCRSVTSHRVESTVHPGTWWCSDTDFCSTNTNHRG